MGLFDFFRKPDMSQGLARYEAAPGASLLDVRTPGEYAEGHIPGSINVPLQQLNSGMPVRVPDRSTPIFVYCYSGARSSRAVSVLRSMGYQQVNDLGGINAYHGKVERSA